MSIVDPDYVWMQSGPSFCPRCLESRKIAYRVVSDIMDIEVCDDCAIEVWRYDGPIGRLRVEVIK